MSLNRQILYYNYNPHHHYTNVTTGYGPDCLTLRGAAHKNGKRHRVQLTVGGRGPVGYPMGKLQIIEHDGRGKLQLVDHPFIVLRDFTTLDVGSYRW